MKAATATGIDPFPAGPKKLSGLGFTVVWNQSGWEGLRAKTREEKEADFKHFA